MSFNIVLVAETVKLHVVSLPQWGKVAAVRLTDEVS